MIHGSMTPPILLARLAVGLVLLLAASTRMPAADWPEFLGPTRDNISPEKGLRQNLSADGVPVVWKREVGTGYSAPSIKGQTLVLHHRLGGEEIVEACDAATGKTIWKKTYPTRFIDPIGYNNGPRCSPLVRLC